MRVLKRNPQNNLPVEVLLNDIETPLFQWYLQLRTKGMDGEDAWDLMSYSEQLSDRQDDALNRQLFYHFLNYEIPSVGKKRRR
jgi:hypothetical protein